MYSIYKNSYSKLFSFTNLTDKEFHEVIFFNETSKELNTDIKIITNDPNENCCNYCAPENFCKIIPTNLFSLLHINIHSYIKIYVYWKN